MQARGDGGIARVDVEDRHAARVRDRSLDQDAGEERDARQRRIGGDGRRRRLLADQEVALLRLETEDIGSGRDRQGKGSGGVGAVVGHEELHAGRGVRGVDVGVDHRVRLRRGIGDRAAHQKTGLQRDRLKCRVPQDRLRGPHQAQKARAERRAVLDVVGPGGDHDAEVSRGVGLVADREGPLARAGREEADVHVDDAHETGVLDVPRHDDAEAELHGGECFARGQVEAADAPGLVQAAGGRTELQIVDAGVHRRPEIARSRRHVAGGGGGHPGARVDEIDRDVEDAGAVQVGHLARQRHQRGRRGGGKRQPDEGDKDEPSHRSRDHGPTLSSSSCSLQMRVYRPFFR